MNNEFNRYYPDSCEPFKSQLRQFRQAHSLKALSVNGIQWTYLSGGEGEYVVLVLHGGGGVAESLFRYIRYLEEGYRVIAPTIPTAVTRIADALEGILAVLDREAIPAVHLFGVSNGGMIGQCLVRKCPEKIRTLILFHSMLPSREYAQVFSRRVKTLSSLPRWVTVSLGYRWLERQIQAEAPNALPGELSFWSAYFREFYDAELVSKEYFVSRAKILVDYFGSYDFEPHDLDDWPGRIFIIESENDQVVNEFERERLKSFYRQARVHTFRGAGHLGGGLFKVEETIELIQDFLAFKPVNPA